MFVSVILQALLDVSKDIITKRDEVDKNSAKAWFFSSVGVTCENFESVCDMAGVNPERTRTFAYKVINADNKFFLRKRIRNVLRGEDE